MTLRPIVCFSPQGDFFANVTPDGTLKIWDTKCSSLVLDYTPSSHLSATWSCIWWGNVSGQKLSFKRKCQEPGRTNSTKKQKKQSSDFIALGTNSGSVQIFDPRNGEIISHLDGGHTDKVTDVCWHPDGTKLYSCSLDRFIIEWDVSDGSILCKWKADKGGVSALGICETNHYLISAGRSIKIWNLDTKELMKTFVGHASEVIQLLPVPIVSTGSNAYFLSSAVNDRLLQAWNIGVNNPEKSSMASFSLEDEAYQIFLSSKLKNGQSMMLGAIIKEGKLLLYEHVFNGFSKKPYKPAHCIQVVSGNQESAVSIPILSSYFTSDDDSTVLISYGSFLKPTFEKLTITSLENHNILVRQHPHKTILKSEETSAKLKVKESDISKHATVLTSAQLTPSHPCNGETSHISHKRKQVKSDEMTINERLVAMDIGEAIPSNQKDTPTADSLVILLAQALQSDDKKIMNQVLQHTNESIIKKTVKNLPLSLIKPLAKELSQKMSGHAQSGHGSLKWLKTVMISHASYLISQPELIEIFGSVHQMMNARVITYSKLCKLQGKLDLMLSQISAQTEVEADANLNKNQTPLMTYQDDSSDEDIDDELIVASEMEDVWEEESDMDIAPTQDDEDDCDDDSINSNSDSDDSSDEDPDISNNVQNGNEKT